MAEPAPGGEPGAGENAELPEAQTAPSGAASAAFAPWPRLAGTVQDVLGSPMGWGSRFSLRSPREGEESRASAEVCVCVHSGEHRTWGPGFSAFLFKPLELVFCMTWLCLQGQEHSGCPTSSPLVRRVSDSSGVPPLGRVTHSWTFCFLGRSSRKLVFHRLRKSGPCKQSDSYSEELG